MENQKETSFEKETPLLKPHILVVDDEQLLRESVKKILTRKDMIVDTAYDYNSTRKKIEKTEFDLILVDIVLPRMSGIELIQKLKEEFDFQAAIIFITGEPNLDTAIESIRLGAVDYLEKPVKSQILINSIKRGLSRKKNLEIINLETHKTITLSDKTLYNEPVLMDPNLRTNIQDHINQMYQALYELKKKYGNSFTEEQRNLLNTIAKSNSAINKLLKKFL